MTEARGGNHGKHGMSSYLCARELPQGLEGLTELALDLRWTWSHFSDRLWAQLDPQAWERTGNPYFILQSVPLAQLQAAARDATLRQALADWLAQRRQYLDDAGWYGQADPHPQVRGIAYFSMEFGLGEALPIYSGGLGILAGDHLKASSDLGVPLVGIGLLYQQGYFRQSLGADGWQIEALPHNDPVSLPIVPVQDPEGGGWLRLTLQLPGRTLLLRTWQAQVGKVRLYLLDSNDPFNSPRDRGITANLYPAGQEQRLMQEIALGVGGWLLVETLGLDIDVCHLNEGHAAFAVLARARRFMLRTGQPFPVALCATRAGNVFTTHTPVEAAFDRFDTELIRPYAWQLSEMVNLPEDELLALGRKDPANAHEPFNMAYLAMRGSGFVNGVSRLHAAVSRRIFQALYPSWPEGEVPVHHVTNGVHVPSWDSAHADALWTTLCGKGRWMGTLEVCPLLARVSDAELWQFRAAQRQALVSHVRRRLVRQYQEHGAPADLIERAKHILDPTALTLGFARRFTAYKRPTLLLYDRERLVRILSDPDRPVQLIVAGKAHPMDAEGKRLLQVMAQCAQMPNLRDRVVFLEDYEIGLAQDLVAGVDLWLNTPRRPWEACGTSGMKVLVNGGLNLSELDGWWAEAYTPDVGWALGDGKDHPEPEWDAVEAAHLYNLLEQEVIPEFYTRNTSGIPRAWVARIKASMSRLTPEFSSNRMVREYVLRAYAPAAAAFRLRAAENGKLALEVEDWRRRMAEGWPSVRFGAVRTQRARGQWSFEVEVDLGALDSGSVRVELYAEPEQEGPPVRVAMERNDSVSGKAKLHRYRAQVPASRPAEHYTPRLLPVHPDAAVPLEAQWILWKT